MALSLSRAVVFTLPTAGPCCAAALSCFPRGALGDSQCCKEGLDYFWSFLQGLFSPLFILSCWREGGSGEKRAGPAGSGQESAPFPQSRSHPGPGVLISYFLSDLMTETETGPR